MTKVKDVWSFSCNSQKGGGPLIPNDRSGFVSVTRGGTLKVVYQHGSDRWLEAKADLKELGGMSDLLTHAAVCPDKTGEKKGVYFRYMKTCPSRTKLSRWLVPGNTYY